MIMYSAFHVSSRYDGCTSVTRMWSTLGRLEICLVVLGLAIFGACEVYVQRGFLMDNPVTIEHAALLMEYCLFHQFCNDVADQDVALLNTRGFVRRHTDAVIHRVFEISAGLTGQGDRVQPYFLRSRYTAKHIR